jgi:hypothetical protein
MKKLLFTLLCSGGLMAQSTTGVALKMRYTPQTVYTVVQNSATNMTMTFSGAEEVLNELKEQGIDNPIVQNNAGESVIEFSTGKLSQGGFPVEMRFVSTTDENLKKVLKPNTVIYGHGTTDNFPVFDSISDISLDEKFRDMLLETMQSVMSQIKYPEEKMQVGQSATLKTPVTLPVGPVVLNIDINSTYTLKSIKGNIANFDMDIVCVFNGSFEGHNIVAGGSGTGTLAYDTAAEYYKSYGIDVTMQASFEDQGVALNINMNQKTSATADIKKK